MDRAARAPDWRIPCPDCGPARRSPANRIRPVCGVWKRDDGSTATFCNRCGAKDSTRKLRLVEHPTSPSENSQPLAERSQWAQALWSRAIAIEATPAATYLKKARGLSELLPHTLRYLPARGAHPHAMIAAFGIVGESAPGVLEAPACVPAVHLTRLAPDGRSRLDKRMIGRVSGHPLVLAPPNDGLGLAISEGIEDAISIHQATGLGAWAGGSAVHMAKLGPAVPDWIECVTLAEDVDGPGKAACDQLSADLFLRGIEVRRFRAGGT